MHLQTIIHSVAIFGKIKRGHAFRSHILTKKTTKLTRGYRQPNYVDKTNAATIKSMLPYA